MSSIIDDMEAIKRLADNILSPLVCSNCNRDLLGGGYMGSDMCSFCYKDNYNDRDMDGWENEC